VSERYDAVVIGLGPGGEVAAGRLLAASKRVAVVERELIGGECAYWACIPSKTLLRATEARAAAGRVAGIERPEIDWPALRDYRDYMVRHLDDSAQVEGYTEQGATVIKGDARLTSPGRVEVGDRVLEADHVIVATGSEPLRPPIEGLEGSQVWTNREATTLREVPGRVVVLGGSAVGVELGQFLARMGARVSIVETADRLVSREHHRVGELTRGVLEAEGIEVHTGAAATRVLRAGATTTVEVADGTHIDTDVVLLATGRRPRTAGIGLDTVGVEVDERGAIPVDERCRAADGLWALGDVTGVALFTHVAMYQGRVVADNILGHTRTARYEGIPRVVFSDPEVAAVGSAQAPPAAPASRPQRPRSPSPTRSPGRGPTRRTRPARSASSWTESARCSSGPGRWLRSRASGSTSPRSPSGPRSPSTSWSTRSPRSPPTPRPT